MSIFNRPKTISVEKQKAVLVGQRNPLTGHAVLMTEEDAKSHRAFIRDYSAALKPDGMVEIQLAQRLTKNFHANMRLLLRFQSLRQPAQTKEIARAAAA